MRMTSLSSRLSCVDHRGARHLARAVLLLQSAALVIISTGCLSSVSTCQTPRANEAQVIRVVRVRTDSTIRAGTPVAPYCVLTTVDWEDAFMPGIVAAGSPLQLHHDIISVPQIFPPNKAHFPMLAAYVGAPVYHANRIGPANLKLVAGQTVLMAGYGIEHSDYNDATIWEAPAHIITAKVIQPPTGQSHELVWLSAPTGDYCGFRGGPVAVESAVGDAEVIGVILFQLPAVDTALSPSHAIIAARMIPATLAERLK